MESEKNQAETQTPESVTAPASASASASSCYKAKYDENAGFMANMLNKFTEFVHAPMAQHKACFKETYQKVFPEKTETYVKMVEGLELDPVDGLVESVTSIFNSRKKD